MMYRPRLPWNCIVIGVITVLIAGPCAADEQEQPSSAEADLLPGCPDWLPKHSFLQKRFTFVRIEFLSGTDQRLRFVRPNVRHRGHWATDYPDADHNLSAQLGRHTTLDVDPDGKVLKLTDPALPVYPFIYMAEPGSLTLKDAEVAALRRYLLGGGFLMVDDIWGDDQWQRFHAEMKRVFPEREPRELPLEHGIFRCVFNLQEKPQVPSIHQALDPRSAALLAQNPVSYRSIHDDDGRMMVVICHNTDLADGWEREKDSPVYYREFSAKKAYPMAINIIFFALTQ